jgi:hypothetical protein
LFLSRNAQVYIEDQQGKHDYHLFSQTGGALLRELLFSQELKLNVFSRLVVEPNDFFNYFCSQLGFAEISRAYLFF